jgi:hypothetical protein
VAQRRDELVLLRAVEWPTGHHGHVDVAPAVTIAAQRSRAREVDTDELVSEQRANALDQGVEVGG